MKNIAKAIIEVMKAVKGMEKNSHVGSGNHSYNGTKDQDVKEVFNEAFANAKLCILPIDIQDTVEVSRWEEKTNYGLKQKQSVFTTAKVKYMLLHESGESVELMGYGHGVDTQDKGAGKATTYALKNCLLYTFLTPVGKIDDTDTTHSNDIQAPAKKAPVTPPPKKEKAKVQYNEEMARRAIAKGTTLADFKAMVNVSPEEEKLYTTLQNEFSKS